MSNSQAIAAVTSMLDYLITQSPDKTDIEKVTTRPLDMARETGATESQINIFLYQTAPNAAWRNMDMPGRTRPGETGTPPLALTLYYLITAYGKDDISAHLLLGHAMQVLHDHSIITRADIDATRNIASLNDEQKSALLKAELQNQVDLLHITPVPLPLDELSRLWSTFVTPYRVSAAYEVSVVLIESTRAVKTPLPVLTRGRADTGVSVQPHLMPSYPRLETAGFPNKQTSIRSGETLILRGAQLTQDGGKTRLRLNHPQLTDKDGVIGPIEAPTAAAVKVKIPDDWPAGFYTVTAQVEDKKSTSRTSNALSFALAPTIIIDTKKDVAPATLAVTCKPAIAKGQRVSLLLGDRELLPQEPKEITYSLTSLTFDVKGVEPGKHFVRLRVDGVDSHLIDYSKKPPVFYDSKTHKVSL